MKNISNFLLPQIVALALFSSAGMAAEPAKKQLDRATDGKQHTGTTFDGSKEKRGGIDTTVKPSTSTATVDTTVKPSTSTATQTRTQEQAIKEYKESGKTTDAERKAIENYKNSGKSRSGK